MFIFILILVSAFLLQTPEVEGAQQSSERKPAARLRQGHARNHLGNAYLHPTNRKKVMMMCHNQKYLIFINNMFQGTYDTKLVRRYGRFEIQIFTVGVVKIFNVRAKKFLAFSEKGKVYATQNKASRDTLFRQTQKHNKFSTFHSVVHRYGERKLYLALRKRPGRLKRPRKTSARHRSVEFLTEDWNLFKTRSIPSR